MISKPMADNSKSTKCFDLDALCKGIKQSFREDGPSAPNLKNIDVLFSIARGYACLETRRPSARYSL